MNDISIIPDCRTNEYYNQKYLNKKDAEFLMGYDWAIIQITEQIFDNLDMSIEEFDIEGEDLNLARFLENHEKVREKLREAIVRHGEMNRDELVTSMIDGMNEDEFEKIKQEVDSGVKEPYFKERKD